MAQRAGAATEQKPWLGGIEFRVDPTAALLADGPKCSRTEVLGRAEQVWA
jgi:hypothetical protein